MSINNTYPKIPVSLDLKILTSGKGDYLVFRGGQWVAEGEPEPIQGRSN